jgi:hypothetical protein
VGQLVVDEEKNGAAMSLAGAIVVRKTVFNLLSVELSLWGSLRLGSGGEGQKEHCHGMDVWGSASCGDPFPVERSYLGRSAG